MAGTDRSRSEAPARNTPVVILDRPQLAENIGAVARAMTNFTLAELRIVNPTADWLGDRARATASRADAVLENARIFKTIDEAVADLNLVLGTTARQRGLVKRVLTPRGAGGLLHSEARAGKRCGLLFGTERTGLEKDAVAACEALVQIPTNPAYASINLGQAVLLLSYEWYQAGLDLAPLRLEANQGKPATKDELEGMFGQLERELLAGGFLKPPEKAADMMRNIRSLFVRADLTGQEVRTLRGIIRCLVEYRSGAG